MSYKVEVVLKDAVSTIGEGPHWDDTTQTLLFVDIFKGDIHRYDPANCKVDIFHLDGGVGFVVPRQKGGLVAGFGKAFVSVDWETKTVTKLAEVDAGTNNKLNDGKCDARGRVWAGTLDAQRTPHKGNLYCLDVDGRVSKQDENFTIPNGMAWSPDNKTMYFIDTTPCEVYAYDYDIDAGKISNRRVVVNFNDIPELSGGDVVRPDGMTIDTEANRRVVVNFNDIPELSGGDVVRPDGMTIDTEGNLWLACFGGGCVAKIEPRTGKLLQKVDIPDARRITSVCWGGQNLDELYVTTLKMHPTSAAFPVIDSLDGSVFRVTGLGAHGSPPEVYRG